ncbi:hypothetical protein QFC22_005585 [Naganishia vaughanmartiniae]|uniref:Uncharacterized protein n=1 Tax=Naganishia vaughanmartiniae TaxID=1424756 RepID=A0ACC2WU59_9TREE|nr:hypothetical protein QFC22_005585 [Naganishia vaughanmartiniae]
MVAYNITIDDTSPVIQYSPGWLFHHPKEVDTKTPLYYGGTFASSIDDGQNATLKFNGTGIWAFGAKRENHGSYYATLDGTPTLLSGYGASPGIFQTVLFSQTGLDPNIEHSLTLVNAYRLDPEGLKYKFYLDVDYYIVQTEETADVANAAGQELKIQTATVDDRDALFTYKGRWDGNFQSPDYYSKTGHVSYDAGDTVSFEFIGTSVAVYGGVNYNHGNYTVDIDGIVTRYAHVMIEYSGFYSSSLAGETVLFQRSHLDNTTHLVIITNEGVDKVNVFGLDYVQYNYTVPAAVATTTSSTSTSTSTSASSTTGLIVATSTNGHAEQPADEATPLSDSAIPGPGPSFSVTADASRESANSISNGIIAGIAIGSVATIACLALLIWLLCRKREKKQSLYHWSDNRGLTLGSSMGDSFKPVGLSDTPISLYHDAPYDGHNGRWPSSQVSPQMMHQTQFMPGDVFARFPEPPASNSTSYYPYAQSVNPPSDVGDAGGHTAQNQRSTDARAYSGTDSSIPAHNTAPSSAAIPSILGDPAEIRVASQAFSMRPELQSVASMRQSPHPAVDITRNISVNSTTPSSIATTGSFGRRKQRGVPLPLTSAPPVSALSEDRLRQMRMIVEGRPQDFGPVSISDDNRSLAVTELPPDYVQATEPLPGQVMNALPRRPGQF